MSKQSQAVQIQAEKNKQPKPETVSRSDSSAAWTGLSRLFERAIDKGIEGQVDRLSAPRLLAIQRQTLVSLIGHIHGNHSLQRVVVQNERDSKPIPAPTVRQSYEDWLRAFPGYPGSGTQDIDITTRAPTVLKDYIVGKLGVLPDCADVSLLLRHYYLKSQGKSFTFRAGPGKKEFTIGKGVTDRKLRECMIDVGTINLQEDRSPVRLVKFYKNRGVIVRNLSQLIAVGLKPGDLMLWKRLSGIRGNFDGHAQTIQAVDSVKGLLTVVQGNMSADDVGAGQLQQRQYTFQDLTGQADGNADIRDTGYLSFFGAGPWIG